MMPSFEESQRDMAVRRKATEFGGDLIECEECHGTHFEQVKITQYLANQPVVIGQEVPHRPGVDPFVLLRCITCGKFKEPNVMRGTRDNMNHVYDEFLDALEKKGLLDSKKEI
jgi:hypothetical protein